MPFSRLELKDILLDAYRPMNIILHPIMFKYEATEFKEAWVEPVIIPISKCYAANKGAYKRNWFITNCTIKDEDYYLTVDDDDMYEAGVFDKVKTFDDDIVIISLKRGYHIPDGVLSRRRYETSTLYACPENVRPGHISTQQSFVKGKVFKLRLFEDSSFGSDGIMAVRRKVEGEQIRYEPGLYALFNYYEPGRWRR